jgi:LysR family transcriptional regulator, glycine cleavage system transcriptional activator
MKRHLPPLNALRAFEAAARLGQMSAASDELAVTPGAVSRQVRQLERTLGIRLFVGPKNKLQLTAAARTLLPVLSTSFDKIESTIRALHNEESGALDVSCFGTFTMKWLIPRLYSFNAEYPEIEIRLATSDRITDTGRYDVIIEVSNVEDMDTATMVPLFSERLGPVMAPSLAAEFNLRSPEDLTGKAVLHTKTRPDAWQMWKDSLGYTFETHTGSTFEHYYFTLKAAISGLGICIAPWHLVIDDILAGRLVAPFSFQESGYFYVAKRCRQKSKKLDRFCEWLQIQAKETPMPQNFTFS